MITSKGSGIYSICIRKTAAVFLLMKGEHMAKKKRTAPNGRVLFKGEAYVKKKKLYSYSYYDALGKRRFIYDKDLDRLRVREEEFERCRLDKMDLYAYAKADVNYVFDRYISTKHELRSSTRSNYLRTYDNHVRGGFGKRRIGEIRYSDVLSYYNALLESGLSISSVDNINTVLHPTFTLAVRDEIIRKNPADGVMADLKKKCEKKPEKRHALSREETKAFLDWVEEEENPRWLPLFVTMFGSGVRVGELIGLRWEDVDFEKGFIYINHNITYCPRSEKGYRCTYEVHAPKTEAGIRSIPLFDKVREVLEKEKKYQEETGIRPEIEIDGYSGFIFGNRFGLLYNDSSINRAIKRMVDDHNAREEVRAKREGRDPIFIPRFSCHITRHTFCTRLCEREPNVKVVQSIMGHKDIQTTLDVYADVTDQMKKESLLRNSDYGIF